MKKSAWNLSNSLSVFQKQLIALMARVNIVMQSGAGMFLAMLLMGVLFVLELIGSRPGNTSFSFNAYDLSSAIADFQDAAREKDR